MWGEISCGSNNKSRIFYDELSKEQIQDLCKIMEQAQQPNCLSNYDISTSMVETKEIVLPSMNSQMLHTGVLHTCAKNMNDVIDEALLALEYNVNLQSEIPTLSIPESSMEKGALFNRNSFNFIAKVHSNFTKGFGPDPPTLSDSTRQQIENKCIATMLAHIGFESTTLSIMNVLTDILESFFNNICKEMKSLHDSILTGESNNFPDIVEQVLVQAGLGGIQGICDYYENRVKKYGKLVEDRNKLILSSYNNLCVSAAPAAVLEAIKSESAPENVDEENIPEMHFTTMDGEESLQPFLPGLQIIDTIEQEGNII